MREAGVQLSLIGKALWGIAVHPPLARGPSLRSGCARSPPAAHFVGPRLRPAPSGRSPEHHHPPLGQCDLGIVTVHPVRFPGDDQESLTSARSAADHVKTRGQDPDRLPSWPGGDFPVRSDNSSSLSQPQYKSISQDCLRHFWEKLVFTRR